MSQARRDPPFGFDQCLGVRTAAGHERLRDLEWNADWRARGVLARNGLQLAGRQVALCATARAHLADAQPGLSIRNSPAHSVAEAHRPRFRIQRIDPRIAAEGAHVVDALPHLKAAVAFFDLEHQARRIDRRCAQGDDLIARAIALPDYELTRRLRLLDFDGV